MLKDPIPAIQPPKTPFGYSGLLEVKHHFNGSFTSINKEGYLWSNPFTVSRSLFFDSALNQSSLFVLALPAGIILDMEKQSALL